MTWSSDLVCSNVRRGGWLQVACTFRTSYYFCLLFMRKMECCLLCCLLSDLLSVFVLPMSPLMMTKYRGTPLYIFPVLFDEISVFIALWTTCLRGQVPNFETHLQLVPRPPSLRSGDRDRVCHVGFCGGQSGAGVGFLRVPRFPLPIFIPPIAPKIILSSIVGVCTTGQSGRSTRD
jgi:hypothetical protein